MDDFDARGAGAPASTPNGPTPRSGLGTVGKAVGLVVFLLVLSFAVCEAMGWPFLAGPVQREMSKALDRPVAFNEDPTASPRISIHLLGHLRVAAPYLRIGAPPWSGAPHMLIARDARLTLGYTDLWRASRGAPLRIRALRAASLDGHFERLADGRASWQFGNATPDPNAAPVRLPTIDLLQVDAGRVDYRDAPLSADLVANFALVDHSAAATSAPAADSSPAPAGTVATAAASSAASLASSFASSSAPASSTSAATGQHTGLQLRATGHYRNAAMKVELKTSGVLPVVSGDATAVELPITLQASAGGASLSFNGTATDVVNLGALKGRFSVQGPSLGALGDPLHVTLPTTGPFKASGLIAKTGVVWNVVAQQMDIGASKLNGAFTYDPRPAVPALSGRLNGSRLSLADLGPAVGAPSPSAPVSAMPAPTVPAPNTSATGRVLPDRAFDLPSLRAMDANVLVDIDNFDLGSSILEPLRPLRTHLVLADGTLQLRDIDARTGQGRLAGLVQLDGRSTTRALWTADLRWAGVRLETWLHQKRKAANAPPYVTGNLSGHATLAGQGKSTAAILGSLGGNVRMEVTDGSLSHLAVEAAGLDIAQALGVAVKGDDALPLQCTVADLVADRGVLRPRVLVLDTPDSTMWIDGSLSMASEGLDLRVVVAPKDFSPLTLRSPLHVKGTFGSPSLSLDKGKLGVKLGAAALLALVNPLAAIVPLVDLGSGKDARQNDTRCRALASRNEKAVAQR